VCSTGFEPIITAATPLASAARDSGQLTESLRLDQILALVAAVA
jgi:hypothetical protein